MRTSTIVMIGVAVLFGLLAVFVAQSWLNSQADMRARNLDAQKKPLATRTIVVAAKPLRFGNEIGAMSLREVPWPAEAIPAGAFGKIAELTSARHVVLTAIEANEPVLASKITGSGAITGRCGDLKALNGERSKVDATNNNKRTRANSGRQQSNRVCGQRGADASRGNQGRRPLATLALIALASAAAVFAPDAPGNAQERLVALSMGARSSSITITAGKTQDVRVDAPFTDVTVGDPEIADVTPLTDHSLSILGKKIGTTRVSIYGEGKRTVGIFDVEVSYDVPRLAAELNRITGGGLRVSSVNGRIMLSGSAPDAVTLDKAVAIARQFAPDVINAVQVLSPQQVVLEVRFVEASREASRELGVQWNSFGKNTLTNIGSQVPAPQLPVTTPGGPFQQQPLITQGSQVGGANVLPNQLPISPIVAAGLLSGTAPFGFLLGALNRGGFSVDVAINALEQKGLIRSLAEPNLVALSGDTASFLAGGEYPIPVPGTLGTVTIDYKTYGVGLSFTPTVLRNGAINLVIKPEVSQLDFGHTVQIAGIAIPPLIVRRASTTIELRDGQSFVIGGLLQNTSSTAQDQLPWLGDIPVLGALFRSAQYKKNETDLAIIVTPRLVRPTRPGDPVKTPLDNTLPANDIDFFLMGKAEISPADARLAVGHQRPFVGHILDLRKEGANVVQVKD